MILIIYAHPKTGGHCPTILDETISYLKKEKKDYKVLDLYEMGYDAILHEEEHYTRGNKDISQHNRMIQKMISDAELLIFIYPVWWFSVPAVLKGFFDRILTPGFAFTYKLGAPIGLLRKKALVMHTTGGPSVFYNFTGNLPKKNIRTILKFCGIKAKVHSIGSSTKFDERREDMVRQETADLIKKYI